MGNNLEVLLNEMGSQGWDLCGIKEDDFIFKRNTNTNTSIPYTVNPCFINPPYVITSTTI